jgi:hypothetical protein
MRGGTSFYSPDECVTNIVQLLNRKPDAKYPRDEKNVQVATNGNIPAAMSSRFGRRKIGRAACGTGIGMRKMKTGGHPKMAAREKALALETLPVLLFIKRLDTLAI